MGASRTVSNQWRARCAIYRRSCLHWVVRCPGPSESSACAPYLPTPFGRNKCRRLEKQPSCVQRQIAAFLAGSGVVWETRVFVCSIFQRLCSILLLRADRDTTFTWRPAFLLSRPWFGGVGPHVALAGRRRPFAAASKAACSSCPVTWW